MIRVNLLSTVARKAAAGRDWRPIVGGVLAVLILLGMGYGWWTFSSEAAALQGRIQSIKAEISQLGAEAKKVDQHKADKKRLEDKLKAIRALLTSQTTPLHLLQAVNDELPDEVWLTSLANTRSTLVIQGYSFSDFGIADLMIRLSRITRLFAEVELVVSQQVEVQKVPLKRFEIICRVVG
ncbi:MAG: PilN domain-containing protein [Candidatus Methylomirabilales bacterium]